MTGRRRPATGPVEPPPPLVTVGGPGTAPARLYRIDALAGLAAVVPRAGVDVVVTSPPYNLGVTYGRYADRRPRAEYLRWMRQVGAAVRDALAPGGSFFLNIAGAPSDPSFPWAVAAEVQRSLVLQNVIHWVKSIVIDRSAVGRDHALARDLAVGHYKPVRSERFLHGAHEYVLHFTHRGEVPLDRLAAGVAYADPSNTGRWRRGESGRRCRGNTWFLPYRTIRFRRTDRPHPASFPPELPERCFRLHGVDRIRIALDPFTGIGASGVAAVRLGLPFVGFDLDEEYLREAARRIEAEQARLAPRAG